MEKWKSGHTCLRIIFQLARQLLNDLENSFFSSTSTKEKTKLAPSGDACIYFSSSQTCLSPTEIV